MAHARIETCRRFERVTGQGPSITITAGSSYVDTLQIVGPWENVLLNYSGPERVHADLVDRLSIGMCQRLTHVRAIEGSDIVVFGGRVPKVNGSNRVRVEPLVGADAR